MRDGDRLAGELLGEGVTRDRVRGRGGSEEEIAALVGRHGEGDRRAEMQDRLVVRTERDRSIRRGAQGDPGLDRNRVRFGSGLGRRVG